MSKQQFVRSSLSNRHPAAPETGAPQPPAEKAAAADTAPAAAATAGEQVVSAPVPAAARTSAGEQAKKDKKRYPPPADHRRFGFYLHAATYDDVKSAYVADRIRRGDDGPATIAAWLTEAIDRYNALSMTDRSTVTKQLGPEQGREAPPRQGNSSSPPPASTRPAARCSPKPKQEWPLEAAAATSPTRSASPSNACAPK